MEANLNFKKAEINAYTLDEATQKLKEVEKVQYQGDFKNATQSWKNAGSPRSNSNEFRVWMAEYLAQHTKNAPGIGVYVVYEAGKGDTRERPYKVNDVVNEKGKRKYVTTYLIKDKKTGVVLAKTTETKSKAKELAKELYKTGEFRGSIVCEYSKEVAEGEKIAFTVDYAPSTSAKIGTFIFGGIERN